jgi:hypothetical protein
MVICTDFTHGSGNIRSGGVFLFRKIPLERH